MSRPELRKQGIFLDFSAFSFVFLQILIFQVDEYLFISFAYSEFFPYIQKIPVLRPGSLYDLSRIYG